MIVFYPLESYFTTDLNWLANLVISGMQSRAKKRMCPGNDKEQIKV